MRLFQCVPGVWPKAKVRLRLFDFSLQQKLKAGPQQWSAEGLSLLGTEMVSRGSFGSQLGK